MSPARATRTASPLAHGPDSECPSCRECPSCDGGSGRLPRTYRVKIRDTDAIVTCTRCEGSGVTCLNLNRSLTRC